MSRPVDVIDPTTTIAAAAGKMRDEDVGCLLVGRDHGGVQRVTALRVSGGRQALLRLFVRQSSAVWTEQGVMPLFGLLRGSGTDALVGLPDLPGPDVSQTVKEAFRRLPGRSFRIGSRRIIGFGTTASSTARPTTTSSTHSLSTADVMTSPLHAGRILAKQLVARKQAV